MVIRIVGTGSSLPEQVVTNEELSRVVDTSDEWIFSRTGIRERHLVKGETTASMSAEAAGRALCNAGIGAEEVDLIIVATITGDYMTPSTACEVQAALGAHRAAAFDINAACSGFLFALHTAYAYLRAGIYKTALVVGAETLSKIVDWEDRSTCVLFGDGAGAAVLHVCEMGTKGNDREEEAGGMLAFEQGTDGARGKVLACRGRQNNNLLGKNPFVPSYVEMDGREVYKFAVSTVPASIGRVLDKAGTAAGEIKYFVLHQANVRIIQSVAKRLKAEEEKFPLSLSHCGNVSAASVPILLDEMNRKGMLVRGDKIVLSGFGGGLSWASAVVEW